MITVKHDFCRPLPALIFYNVCATTAPVLSGVKWRIACMDDLPLMLRSGCSALLFTGKREHGRASTGKTFKRLFFFWPLLAIFFSYFFDDGRKGTDGRGKDILVSVFSAWKARCGHFSHQQSSSQLPPVQGCPRRVLSWQHAAHVGIPKPTLSPSAGPWAVFPNLSL